MKAIKMLAAIVCAALTFGFVGCTPDNEDLIIGTWNVNSITTTISGSPNAEENGTFTQQVPEGYTMTFTFNKDNTGQASESYQGQGETFPFTYTIVDNTISLTIMEGSHGYTSMLNIDKLDRKELIITLTEKTYEEYEDENGEWVEYEYNESLTYNMTKA